MANHQSTTGSLNAKEATVLAALRADRRPHSAYELIGKLRDQGITAPPTVYRALKRLISLGHAHRLESINAYVACPHGHCAAKSSAAFAICDGCGQVEEIDAPTVMDGADAWAEANRFAVNSVTFELHGRCGDCRDAFAEKDSRGGP